MQLFAAMPYGVNTGRLDLDDPSTEETIDFDEVWSGLLRPAIPADWEAKRADELHQPGLITELFTRWLFEADIVLVDLTFGNPNVFYELGIRQALSERSTVLVAQAGTVLPFDVRNQAVLHYDVSHAPSVREFQERLGLSLAAAAAAPEGSPVHALVPGLRVSRTTRGRAPEEELEDLRAEVERLRAEASVEQGSAEQFRRRLAIRSELTDRLSRIIQGQLDNARTIKEHADDAVYQQVVSSTLNTENAFLLNEAVLLVEQIPDLVGSVEYNTVAYALANTYDVTRAEEYYRRAIEVARTPSERAMAQRSFGTFLFVRGRHDEARAITEAALEQLDASDPMTAQTNGFTLQSWAWNEATMAGDGARARELFARARAELQRIPNPALRAQAVRSLESAQRGGLGPAANVTAAAGRLADWFRTDGPT
ncbi:MAG: hypothetical protein AAFZ07_02505 [Actinomycetota bacterium]